MTGTARLRFAVTVSVALWLEGGVVALPAAVYRATSAEDVARRVDSLRPGDVVVMTDGVWRDQAIRFRGQGTPDQPIALWAETPGKVILTGDSSLVIDGENIVVSGLLFKDGRTAGDVVRINGRKCRLTETSIVDCEGKFYVHIYGSRNRLDRCYLAGKTSDSPTVQIDAAVENGRHRIDHNHFGPRPPLRRNGGETIRIGYSSQSSNDAGTHVERNLFERCDGEIEVISNKCCGNVYRFNTFLDCAGFLTLRHGDRCVVESNFFLGRGKRGSGGVRIIGEGHTVINNYIEGVAEGGFRLTSGIPDSPPAGYVRARDILIAFNTVVDSRGPCVEMDAGYGTARRSLRPEKITIANNVFALPDGENVLRGIEGEGFQWGGNQTSANASPDRSGLRSFDLKLERTPDGLWRPRADSPIHNGADETSARVETDIDGQARKQPPDIGCDEASETPVTNRPLTAADVGPSWIRFRHDDP